MMKSLPTISLLALFIFFSCNNPAGKNGGGETMETGTESLPEGHYGMIVTEDGAEDAFILPELMADTNELEIKLAGTITSSCKHSGCWMNVGIGDDKIVAVTFADGNFTIPLDAEGKDVVFEGTAYKELVPVERLKAWARDEGLPEGEIESITQPDWEYTFVAKGVSLRDE